VDGEACFICQNTRDADAPPRERIWRSSSWRVAHAFDSALPGWLVVVPTEHVTSLDQLSDAAATELGPLLRALTAALIESTGCEKTYLMLLAEQEGFSHLHFHVVPRAADLAAEFRGTGVFRLLGAAADQRVSVERQDEVSQALTRALSRESLA
jgi:diadenosine tetraphosphate (Ap4A) HIT family hydrolase